MSLTGAALLLIAACLPLVAPAKALGLGIGVAPSKIDLVLGRGSRNEQGFIVTNCGSSPIVVRAVVSDFFKTNNGAHSFRPPTPVSTLSRWIQVPGEPFLLIAGESRTVTATIRIPALAPPGSHFAGLAFMGQAADAAVAAGASAKMSGVVVAIVSAVVPGRLVVDGRVSRLSASRWNDRPDVRFSLEVENTGNVHLRPVGYVTVRPIAGVAGRETSVPLEAPYGNTVMPKSRLRFDAAWHGPRAGGWYKAEAVVRMGPRMTEIRRATFFVVPWRSAVPIAGAIAILWWLSMRYQVRFVPRTSPRSGGADGAGA